MLQFKVEQIAIHPQHPDKALELLTAMGAEQWVKDQVTAAGYVKASPAKNTANLAFNYDMAAENGKLEFEVLQYVKGTSWMQGQNRASHLGMHCSADELDEWRKFFARRGITVAQEVYTENHTNSAIAGKRWYNYVIFDTFAILGIDIKFIVRKDKP